VLDHHSLIKQWFAQFCFGFEKIIWFFVVKAVLRKMKEQNQHNVDKSRPELIEALRGVYYSK
jgi:hypothetical protein